jgi:hypothetical protein
VPEQIRFLANGDTFKPLAGAALASPLYPSPFGVWVDYDAPANALQVFVGQGPTKPSSPLVSTNVDLAGAVGPVAYAGFTAATGVLRADFDVLSWQVEQVADSTPPTVTCSADPSTLWPPNNKFVLITVGVDVSDSGSGPAGFSLVSVTSNEGDVAVDSKGWTPGTPDTSGFFRATRYGSGSGRVYTLTYEGTDNVGNMATCTATVTVPHDQR